MKRARIAAAALACAFCFATAPAAAAQAVWVQVFEATQLSLDRYTVLKRIWTDTWHPAFWVSTYTEKTDAIAALTTKAADEGADGVINLHCLFDPGGLSSGYFCYGLAIKFK